MAACEGRDCCRNVAEKGELGAMDEDMELSPGVLYVCMWSNWLRIIAGARATHMSGVVWDCQLVSRPGTRWQAVRGPASIGVTSGGCLASRHRH